MDGDLARMCEKVIIMHEGTRKGGAFVWKVRKVYGDERYGDWWLLLLQWCEELWQIVLP